MRKMEEIMIKIAPSSYMKRLFWIFFLSGIFLLQASEVKDGEGVIFFEKQNDPEGIFILMENETALTTGLNAKKGEKIKLCFAIHNRYRADVLFRTDEQIVSIGKVETEWKKGGN
jgi:hypothetical protein